MVPASVTSRLAEYGRHKTAARSGRTDGDPFGWDYFSPVAQAMNNGQAEMVLTELTDAAASDDPHVTIGAYGVLAEIDPSITDPRYLALMDKTLDYLQRNGFSSGHLNGFEASRWVELHGDLRSTFDSIIDAAPVGGAVPLPGLARGESILLALAAPLPDGNAFFVERRGDGSYIIYSERCRSSDDPTRSRYEETYLGAFESMTRACAALGEMFGTPPHWSHDAMPQFYPRRQG